MAKLKISSQLIANEAESRGWDVHYFDDEFSSLVRITPPGFEPQLFRSTVTSRDSYVGGGVTNNKYETYLVLNDAGLPVPKTALFSQQVALDFISEHKMVVVKPASADHGDGVTVNIETIGAALKAAEYANTHAAKAGDIVIQTQLPGSDHRLLVVGERVFAARRRKPIVIGDGIHTVYELVVRKNDDPNRGENHSAPLSKIDLSQVERFLGDRIQEVPQEGDVVEVLGTSNLSSGGESVELTAVMHESFATHARQAARLLSLRVCAVDMMCEDITKPADTQQCGIIEMNVLPGIRMHHFPSEGEPVNVAAAILDEVFGS